MCGRYGRDIPWSVLHEALSLTRPRPGDAHNLEPEGDIRPTQAQWIARQAEDDLELIRARWWPLPFCHRGTVKDFKLTTFNAKAETVCPSACRAMNFPAGSEVSAPFGRSETCPASTFT